MDRRTLMCDMGKLMNEFARIDDTWRVARSVLLPDTEELSLDFDDELFKAKKYKEGIVVSTITPRWAKAITNVTSNSITGVRFGDFLYFVEEYIHQASVITVVFYLACEHGYTSYADRILPSHSYYDDGRPFVDNRTALDEMSNKYNQYTPIDTQELVAEDSEWISCLLANGLNPFVQEAMYHFITAKRLLKNNFFVEAIGRFSNVLECIRKYIVEIDKSIVDLSYKGIAEHLGCNEFDQETAKVLCFARNHFSGHPGGWWWWDFKAVFSKDFLEIEDFVKRILIQMIELEKRNDTTDRSQMRWSEWLWDNFKYLWNTVWFEKLTKFQKKRRA